LAIDFEKNGLNMDPIFEVSVKLEAIEVTYHHVIMLLYTVLNNILSIVSVNFIYRLLFSLL